MKKILIIVSILAVLLFLLFLVINLYNKQAGGNNVISEYTPEEEIRKEDMRSTIVTLYFQNLETKELQPEARSIDSKELLIDPYKTIINLLIDGPKKEQYESLIPKNVKINSVKYDKGIVIIDFSKEFLNINIENNSEKNVINSIVKSLKELKEVDYVRIIIEGEENKKINNGEINLSDNL